MGTRMRMERTTRTEMRGQGRWDTGQGRGHGPRWEWGQRWGWINRTVNHDGKDEDNKSQGRRRWQGRCGHDIQIQRIQCSIICIWMSGRVHAVLGLGALVIVAFWLVSVGLVVSISGVLLFVRVGVIAGSCVWGRGGRWWWWWWG